MTTDKQNTDIRFEHIEKTLNIERALIGLVFCHAECDWDMAVAIGCEIYDWLKKENLLNE